MHVYTGVYIPGTRTYVYYTSGSLCIYSYNACTRMWGCTHCCCRWSRRVWLRALPAQQTQPGPRHRQSQESLHPVPSAKEGPRWSRRSMTTNPWTETPAMELNRLTLGWATDCYLEQKPSYPAFYGIIRVNPILYIHIYVCSRTRYASTWFAYLDSLAFGFSLSHWPQNLYLSRMKNQQGHWGYRW